MSKSSHKHLSVLMSCEHGGNKIPIRYRKLFATQHGDVALSSHRGWDAGVLDLATHLSHKFHLPLYSHELSRLLVDLNRSCHHRNIFSEFTRPLTQNEKEEILELYYRPYRAKVKMHIDRVSRCVHLSLHSFTPVMNGIERNCDIGVLYDPSRTVEKKIADALIESFKKTEVKFNLAKLKVRRNYPYKGVADGFCTSLRKNFPDKNYAGIEIEVNQKWIASNSSKPTVPANKFTENIKSLITLTFSDFLSTVKKGF